MTSRGPRSCPWIPVTERLRRYSGRLPRGERGALNGIPFVLNTGIAWRDLPQGLGDGSGVTCWRRLRDGQAAGVWEELHQSLLAHPTRPWSPWATTWPPPAARTPC